jgi:hypothetical protein
VPQDRQHEQGPAEGRHDEQRRGGHVVTLAGQPGAEDGGASHCGERGWRAGLARDPISLARQSGAQHGSQQQPGTRGQPEHDRRENRLVVCGQIGGDDAGGHDDRP